jgi:hypothetical protein
MQTICSAANLRSGISQPQCRLEKQIRLEGIDSKAFDSRASCYMRAATLRAERIRTCIRTTPDVGLITAISASAGWIVAFAILRIGALIGMTIGLIIPCFGQAIPAEPLEAE